MTTIFIIVAIALLTLSAYIDHLEQQRKIKRFKVAALLVKVVSFFTGILCVMLAMVINL